MVVTYTKDENGTKIDKSKKITNKTRYSIDEYEYEKPIAEKITCLSLFHFIKIYC